jgi:hypothetical protein
MAETVNLVQAENLLSLLAHDDEHRKPVVQIAKPELFEGDYRLSVEDALPGRRVT